MVFCVDSPIILISRWIKAYFLYFCYKYRAQFKSSQWLLCFYISCCAYNKASFLEYWINIYLSTPLFFAIFQSWVSIIYLFKSLLCICRGIISVVLGMGYLLLELTHFPPILSTYSKTSSAFFLEIYKAWSKSSFLCLLVNNIILCFDNSSIKRLSFSS